MEQHFGNVPDLAGRIIAIRPKLHGHENAFRSFCRSLCKRLRTATTEQRVAALELARDDIDALGRQNPTRGEIALKFACSVIVDVVAQGWTVSAKRNCVELSAPEDAGISPEELKQRIRAGHLLERDAQLREVSVREFVKSMEQRRLGPRGWVSIFSLMREGRDLRRQLEMAAQTGAERERLELLESAIDPYLQVVEPEVACRYTGFKLSEIWRYFRHTWVSTYKSLPGRSMMILVRDAAAPNHPVIGIAALGSSMAQQTLRDQWIGWDSETFLAKLLQEPTSHAARWIYASIERLIGAIYRRDFLDKGVITRQEIKKPTGDAIERLGREADKATREHRRNPEAAQHKSNGAASPDWDSRAATALFRAKRAKTLALLLEIRSVLANAGMSDARLRSLKTALEDSAARHSIRKLIRLVKAEHVGVDMMDVIICGAVAPYNAVLGGKLVCLLLASPEVVKFYRERYSGQESVIASSMKGRAVTRPPNLVLLATTSLYGVGSSQYNRVRLPLAELGKDSATRVEYCDLGVSKGYGSYHFSKTSIDYLETLLGRAGGGRKVNSIFGEGVNPLMRKLRDGLGEVGFPTDELLRHGNPRVVYCVALAENFREILMGFQSKPKYLLQLGDAKAQTAAIANYWRRRWLSGRITRPDVLQTVSSHTLAYPITHGARVPMSQDQHGDLFE